MSWIIYAFLAALSAAVVGILSKIGISGIDSTLATTIRGLSITVFMGGAALLLGQWHTLATTSPKTIIFIILTGIFGGLSWLWGFMALKAGGDVTAVNAIDRLSLVFLLILALFFLGEQFTWTKFSGVILIVCGTLLVSFKPEQLYKIALWGKSFF